MAGVAKVEYYGDTLIDLTGDTVTASHLETGYTAHGADGGLVHGGLTVQNFHTVQSQPSSVVNGDLYFLIE